MTNRKHVPLLKKVKIDGKWKKCRLAKDALNRTRWDYVLVNGKPELHREGVYVLDYYTPDGTRHTEAAGKDGLKALDAARRKALELEARKSGLIKDQAAAKDNHAVSIPRAIQLYLEIVEANKEKRTFQAYRPVLSQFAEFCKKAMLNDVTRDDLIDYNKYCAKLPGKHGTGESGTTRRHKLVIVTQMLKHFGYPSLLLKSDWPREDTANNAPYDTGELLKLLATIPERDRIRFKFFLMSGFRDAEGMHVTWRDVDLTNRTIAVTAKPRYQFKPKSHEERTVPIPDELVDLLKHWRPKNASLDDLIFSSSTGRPDTGMHERLKMYAWKAKMNCTHCRHFQKVKAGARINLCSEGPFCSKWDMHKFRHTWSTLLLRSGTDIESMRVMLGHQSLATTQKYVHSLGLDALLKNIRRQGIFTAFGSTVKPAGDDLPQPEPTAQ